MNMANIQRLNNIDHGELRVILGYAEEFGDNVNQTVVFPTEFTLLQREYVILIQKDEAEGYQSVAMLGLDKNENLFVGDTGIWHARYVPAMHQRGPFMIGFQNSEIDGEVQREPMIHVDLDHPRINDSGEPIFLQHGGNTPYLNHIIGALQTIHEGFEVMPAMFAAFEAHGLLQNVPVTINLSETEQYNIEDYYTINADRFAGLDGEALQQLNKAGYLAAAHAIMTSLSNADLLVALKNQRRR
jgi:hypothetical protein